MSNIEDYDDIICPYCGHTEPRDVGMGFTHTCEGTRKENIRIEKDRKIREKENRERLDKLKKDARILMRCGFISYNEALFLAQGIDEEEDDY